MTEPVRWLDDPAAPDALKRALRARPAAPVPPPLALDRARASRGGAGGSVVGKSVTWIAGASVVLVGFALYFTAFEGAGDGPVNKAAVTKPLEARASTPRSTPARPTLVVRPRVTAAPVEPPLARAPIATPVEASLEPPIARGAGLVDEAQLLARARSSLASDPSGALELTRRHEREFARGELTLEREVVAIDALLRLGHHDAARARASAMEARFPSALYRARIARLLARARP
jgi:hypothetical protein